ncbi:MAG: YigZ family protein [Pleomorphochaeta sp.]
MSLRVPTNQVTTELIIKKSKFITIATRINNYDELKLLINKTRKDHPNARHVVHAAILGNQGTIYSFSDDKEPKNTAGKPAFEVLKGSGLTNIAVLIIRYFGGTLLGTGGLVKAYGESTKNALLEITSEELIKKSEFIIKTSYDRYEKIKLVLKDFSTSILDENFETHVTIKGTLPYSMEELLQKEIIELSNAKDIITFSKLDF